MMTYSSTTQCSHIDMMFCKLRYANARYSRIAQEMRKRMEQRITYIPNPRQLRAAWLGLRVDTEKAVALSDSQVSKIPLPVLDTDPSPIVEKIFLRIPRRPSALSHTIPLPVIMTTAPTPIHNTNAKLIPTIRIPARAPRVGNDWGVPGAPLMVPKDLPVTSPQTDYCPMSLDSDLSCPSTPQHQDNILSRVRIPLKRKIENLEEDFPIPYKYEMRKRWAQATSSHRTRELFTNGAFTTELSAH